jgi:antitoxin component of RelBE/YafQ-DinJ toxin-antitoxin module
MEVQNANLNIRIPLKLRERFVEVANNNGLTHSVVLRTMVAEYVRANGKLEIFKHIGK